MDVSELGLARGQRERTDDGLGLDCALDCAANKFWEKIIKSQKLTAAVFGSSFFLSPFSAFRLLSDQQSVTAFVSARRGTLSRIVAPLFWFPPSVLDTATASEHRRACSATTLDPDICFYYNHFYTSRAAGLAGRPQTK